MTFRWSTADLADAIAAGLRAQAAADDLEQAVYGFDSRDELGLHPLIQQALRTAGYGVYPEQRYPGDWNRSKRTEGKRCDIVLAPDEGPRGLREPHLRGTLFDHDGLLDPEEAYWLEIKTVAQFERDGPFKRYTSELLSPVAQDVKKLWGDGGIFHAGLLLVLFTASEMVGTHDLGVWHQRCIERGYPVAAPNVRCFPIAERIGNACCHVAVFPVRGV